MDAPQGVTNILSGTSNVSARDIRIVSAGRDIHLHNHYNPAPISGPEASVEEVTEWLKGANFREVYRLSLEARMDDTGTWLIATFEFGEFVAKRGTVVWATGLPGSGKTILASISIEHLEDLFRDRTDVALIYAFLRYSEKPTLLQIVAGFLDQLVKSHRNAFSHIHSIYQRSRRFRDQLSCWEAIEALAYILALFSDAFIIIDGLDEVDDATKDGLLSILPSLNAHILFTCRPLDLFMRRHTPHALHIPVQAQTRDIEIYIAKRIKENTKLAVILNENPALSEQFSTFIKDKAQGMFLLARLQMEIVLEKCTTVETLLEALETLPTGVKDMYRTTMERIKSQSEVEVSIAHRAFLWVLHARNSLSPWDLQEALTFSFDKLEFNRNSTVSIPMLLSICHGLIAVEEQTQGPSVVRFIHYSAEEFMKTMDFSHLPEPQELISVTCVASIHVLYTTPVCGPAPSDAVDSLPSELEASTQPIPLVGYASFYWGYHAKICDEQRRLHPFIISYLAKDNWYTIDIKPTTYREPISWNRDFSSGLHLAAWFDLSNLISSHTLPYPPERAWMLPPRLANETPFHIAAERDNPAALRALLKCYRGVCVQDEFGCTPLHLARGWEVAQELLNLSPFDSWRAYPLEIVDVNALDTTAGCSALYRACQSHRGSDKIASEDLRLLRLFALHPTMNPNLPCFNGETAFSVSVSPLEYGTNPTNRDLPHFLISSFPNLEVNTRNRGGETPFMLACDSCLEDLVIWFLKRTSSSANPGPLHEQDNEGNTASERIVAYEGLAHRRLARHYPLDFQKEAPAVVEPRPVAILSILANHGSFVRMSRSAQELETLPIYRLQALGAEGSSTISVHLSDVRRRYEDGRTALMLTTNYPLAVKYLISKLGDEEDLLNAQDDDGRSALMYACFGQDARGVRLSVGLLTSCYSINVHLRDQQGMSALEYALLSGNFEASNILLNHPSWNSSSIRSATLAASQKPYIGPRALERLLKTRQVQEAFSWRNLVAGDLRRDAVLVVATLRRRVDYRNFRAKAVGGCVFRDPTRGFFWSAIAWLAIADLDNTCSSTYSPLTTPMSDTPLATHSTYDQANGAIPSRFAEELGLHIIQWSPRDICAWDTIAELPTHRPLRAPTPIIL
ncbi:hypothetical protein D9611_005219 [Ephemerocybe angulata]|uniref:Nephrocystin 3-like N-terminal domain-containing protein n=1 Tax=Ephemerocybe angulata TaxID=980116 RepID=A0A8H5FDR2_9AGAR|nr:hypothetical protein D9611_005219 [Tulosesus angulatus]